jgi:hypothetical protein
MNSSAPRWSKQCARAMQPKYPATAIVRHILQREIFPEERKIPHSSAAHIGQPKKSEPDKPKE